MGEEERQRTTHNLTKCSLSALIPLCVYHKEILQEAVSLLLNARAVQFICRSLSSSGSRQQPEVSLMCQSLENFTLYLCSEDLSCLVKITCLLIEKSPGFADAGARAE